MKKTHILGFVITCLFTFFTFLSNTVVASSDDGVTRAFSGRIACGGNHFNRSGGNEHHSSVWGVRNLNAAASISVNRIRIYDATGVIRFDSSVDGFPDFNNGVLNAADKILGPYQSANLSSSRLFGDDLFPDTERPLQTYIDWSANQKVLLLESHLVRRTQDRNFDPITGQFISYGREISRHHYDCRHIGVVTQRPAKL